MGFPGIVQMIFIDFPSGHQPLAMEQISHL